MKDVISSRHGREISADGKELKGGIGFSPFRGTADGGGARGNDAEGTGRRLSIRNRRRDRRLLDRLVSAYNGERLCRDDVCQLLHSRLRADSRSLRSGTRGAILRERFQ